MRATLPETSDASTSREMRSSESRGASVGFCFCTSIVRSERVAHEPNSNEVMRSGKWPSSCMSCSWMTACRHPAPMSRAGANQMNVLVVETFDDETCEAALMGAAAGGAAGGSGLWADD